MSNLIFYKILHLLIISLVFFSDVIVFGYSAEIVTIAILGSISGGLTLGYFRKEKSRLEFLTKILVSSISGFFFGAFISKYYKVTELEYNGIIFFLSSLLSLFVLRALVSLTEHNTKDILILVFQRVFLPKQQTPSLGEHLKSDKIHTTKGRTKKND